MNKSPIFQQLIKLYHQQMVSFHTPGHKNGNIYNSLGYHDFKNNILNIDTTEIPFTDNLFSPMGCIKEAQHRAAEVFGSQETFFLVNGSTSGVYSMIMAATKPGDKIIIARNSHKSVINSVFLGDLDPIFLYPETDDHQGIAMGIDAESLDNLLFNNPDVKAVVITYPTYHGIACDLKKIAEITHKYDKILLVDEAHGAHLGLSNQLPATALECGADGVVQSTHKTLPAFTQSSMLHIQGDRIDREKLRFMLQLHQSSSPSYILMASLDMATMIYQTKGKDLMEKLLESIHYLQEKLLSIEGLHINDKSIIGNYQVKDIDITKLWISHKAKGITGPQLEEKLRSQYSIQLELSNIYGALAITTIGNNKRDFERLIIALQEISKEKGKAPVKEIPPISYKSPVQGCSFKKAIYHEKILIPLDECNGRISGEYLIPYPPGIPLIIPGEIIDKEVIKYIKLLRETGVEVLGPSDGNCQYINIVNT
ncbi:aminotransferase class I/II-fold pyridoxal phosphate-dependent enzyme [Alkaliphilus serpentinus]|uniref:Aminotransferase class I/II-fold pyridoxal phosphate-dependent enzyme n=1 Tax=Alkaliphilus serpentinus TaxID=1482731 RepID=A0A833M838_9FIRM|nr:aminotransferase class I/II-fold pyridoxal phosphate-dependent enzyme [Alkaliphilus serpentinus]KAB3531807.1 aminotransferase class I/II-fold pyridoxal phosphate-dependent enzyme [Alkaliphilus serpentinus]